MANELATVHGGTDDKEAGDDPSNNAAHVHHVDAYADYEQPAEAKLVHTKQLDDIDDADVGVLRAFPNARSIRVHTVDTTDKMELAPHPEVRHLIDPDDPSLSLSMVAMMSQDWGLPLAGMKTKSGKASKSGKSEKLCVHGYVDCSNGYVIDNRTQTCADACGSSCCYGYAACSGFTGKICKDGKSCVGMRACLNGKVKSVVNGCIGENACYSGTITESVVNGCIGENACNNGNVTSVVNGCNGTGACVLGKVESIFNGCNGKFACFFAGGYGGTVGSIQDSCNGYSACDGVGFRGSIGSILHSCNAYKACFKAGASTYYGYYGGGGPITSNLKTCCNEPNVCEHVSEATLPEDCDE